MTAARRWSSRFFLLIGFIFGVSFGPYLVRTPWLAGLVILVAFFAALYCSRKAALLDAGVHSEGND